MSNRLARTEVIKRGNRRSVATRNGSSAGAGRDTTADVVSRETTSESRKGRVPVRQPPRQRPSYRVIVRGTIPYDIVERVSKLHAQAALLAQESISRSVSNPESGEQLA